MDLPEQIVTRLTGRAAQNDGNANTFRASGYPAEALRYEAKAAAFRLAAEDVEALFDDAEKTALEVLASRDMPEDALALVGEATAIVVIRGEPPVEIAYERGQLRRAIEKQRADKVISGDEKGKP